MKTLDLSALKILPTGGRGVALTSANGLPLLNAKQEQLFVGAEQFLLERTGDEAFACGVRGYDLAELVVKTRQAVRAQLAYGDGLVVLEDAHAKHLVASILDPKGGFTAALLHNFWPFISAAKHVVDGDLRAELQAKLEADAGKPVAIDMQAIERVAEIVDAN